MNAFAELTLKHEKSIDVTWHDIFRFIVGHRNRKPRKGKPFLRSVDLVKRAPYSCNKFWIKYRHIKFRRTTVQTALCSLTDASASQVWRCDKDDQWTGSSSTLRRKLKGLSRKFNQTPKSERKLVQQIFQKFLMCGLLFSWAMEIYLLCCYHFFLSFFYWRISTHISLIMKQTLIGMR